MKNINIEHSIGLSDIISDELVQLRQVLTDKFRGLDFRSYYEKAYFPTQIITRLRDLQLIRDCVEQPYVTCCQHGYHFVEWYNNQEYNKFKLDQTHNAYIYEKIVRKKEINIHLYQNIFMNNQWKLFNKNLFLFDPYLYQLVFLTLISIGSDKQKQVLLPRMANLDLISGWCLTEPNIGSDASRIETTIYKNRLNGCKRLWCRNVETKGIECQIVSNSTPGVMVSKIERKISMRIVQNSEIRFDDVLVQPLDIGGITIESRIASIKRFKDTTILLANSRLFVIWIAIGIGLRIVDMVNERFRISSSTQQLMNSKQFTHIVYSIKASVLFGIRLLSLSAHQSIINICLYFPKLQWLRPSLLKQSEIQSRWLEIDILTNDEEYMMRAMDMETIFTYEGTYDINALVAGANLTGIPAYKL